MLCIDATGGECAQGIRWWMEWRSVERRSPRLGPSLGRHSGVSSGRWSGQSVSEALGKVCSLGMPGFLWWFLLPKKKKVLKLYVFNLSLVSGMVSGIGRSIGMADTNHSTIL